MATLVDSHVHLDRYPDEEVAAMVSRAATAGVRRLLTIGVDLATSRAALDLAARHPSILAAVGVHPTRLREAWRAQVTPQQLDAEGPPSLMRADRMGRQAEQAPPLPVGWGGAELLDGLWGLLERGPAAIGEVGLDAGAPDLDEQRRFLAGCFALAEERALPLVLHVVGDTATHEQALAIARKYPGLRTVAHYFVGGPELARGYLDAGCWISVGRPVTRPTDLAVRAAVPTIPLDRLLLETDTYPLPGRTTEPRDVATVCAAVAELTGQTYEEIAAATTANFARFIGA